MTEKTQWRVSWEMVGPFERSDLYSAWSWVGPFSAIGELDWRFIERVTDDESDARRQYSKLLEWATDQTEAIRNVKLEMREPGAWLAAAT